MTCEREDSKNYTCSMRKLITYLIKAIECFCPPPNKFVGDSGIKSVRLCVHPSRPIFFTNGLTFSSQTLHIYFLPQNDAFSQVFTKIQIQNGRFRAAFQKVFRNVQCEGEALPRFSCGQQSVGKFKMAEPKFGKLD